MGFLGAWIQMLCTNGSAPFGIEADTLRSEGGQGEGWNGSLLGKGPCRTRLSVAPRPAEMDTHGGQVSLFPTCLHSTASDLHFQVWLRIPGCPEGEDRPCACPTSSSASGHFRLNRREGCLISQAACGSLNMQPWEERRELFHCLQIISNRDRHY